MPSDLHDLDVDELSPVRRGANRKRWALLKADEAGVEMSQANVDALAAPLPDEESFVAKLADGGLGDDAQEATVAALRLLAAHPDAALKAAAYWPDSTEHTPAEAAAIAAASEDDEDEEDALDEDAEPSADVIAKRTFTAAQRRAAARMGAALPDGSFPVFNRNDLRDAIDDVGRAENPDAARRHIIHRAKALDAEDMIPEDWGRDVAKSELASRILKALDETLTAEPVTATKAATDEEPRDLAARITKSLKAML